MKRICWDRRFLLLLLHFSHAIHVPVTKSYKAAAIADHRNSGADQNQCACVISRQGRLGDWPVVSGQAGRAAGSSSSPRSLQACIEQRVFIAQSCFMELNGFGIEPVEATERSMTVGGSGPYQKFAT